MIYFEIFQVNNDTMSDTFLCQLSDNVCAQLHWIAQHGPSQPSEAGYIVSLLLQWSCFSIVQTEELHPALLVRLQPAISKRGKVKNAHPTRIAGQGIPLATTNQEREENCTKGNQFCRTVRYNISSVQCRQLHLEREFCDSFENSGNVGVLLDTWDHFIYVACFAPTARGTN